VVVLARWLKEKLQEWGLDGVVVESAVEKDPFTLA
jgi:hypothetical protein